MLNRKPIAALAVIAALSLATGAQAQYYAVPAYQPEPLYPYVVQPQYPQYVYPVPQRSPHIRHVDPTQAQAAPRKRASKTDPALIEELRKGRPEKLPPISKTIVVREKPIVRDNVRVVDDPAIVVQREINEEALAPAPPPRGSRAEQDAPGRVIHAEAEVTILGPDRMSIRLYRKRDGSDANAKVIRKN